MSTFKRIISLVVAAVCLVGCLAGCEKDSDPEIGVTPAAPVASDAQGRYVEETIPLPEGCKYIRDMVMLSDGRLRLSATREDGSGFFCTTDTSRQNWTETWNAPEEILASGSLSQIALSPDGTVFCQTYQDADAEGNYSFHFWVITPQGDVREIPITYPDLDLTQGYLSPSCDFTDSGKLMMLFYFSDVREVNLETGELGENVNELEKMVRLIGCAGESTYIMGISSNSVSVHTDGETTVLDNVMGQQLSESLKATEGNDPKLCFWRNQEGYTFFTTHEGLYSFVPGGSVTEELVSGARSSLGDPTCYPVAVAGSDDGAFYVLGRRYGGENVLLRYVYDASAPTVAATQLRIYSLYQDDDIRQMVSQYLTAHPEVDITLEVGLTGEDGVTAADAIRTLNTQILAGDGPDLICMDGFNLDSYLDKGALADLSGVLAQAEPTLEQITHCYAADGKLCAVPTTFTIPVAYGPADLVSQIHDFDSVVEASLQAKAARPDAMGVLAALRPTQTADMFYDSCSAAWLNADGSLNEEALTEFYSGMQKIYALEADLRAQWADWLAEEGEESFFAPGEYTGVSGSVSMGNQGYCIGFGTLEGMWHWSYVLAAESLLEGSYAVAPLNLQSSNVFLPRRIMGILAGCKNPQAAESFLTFMLSQEVQDKDLSTGLPVSQAAFDKVLSEERVIDSFMSFSDADGNEVSVQNQWPDAQKRQQMRAWVDDLTTPALTDRTVRNMIMEQMTPCLEGEITPEEAAAEAIRALNLYLTE